MVGNESGPWLKLDGGFEFVESNAVASALSPTKIYPSFIKHYSLFKNKAINKSQ
jgi:hypothetical protein